MIRLNNIHYNQIPEDISKTIPGRGDLRITLTSKCNLKCIHCHNEGQEAPWLASTECMTIEQVHDLLKVGYEFGIKSVKFTGGDPTVFPDFFELLSNIESWRSEFPNIKKWGLSTNGVLFVKQKYFKALVNSALDNICIGMDSIEIGEKSKPSSKVGLEGMDIFEKFIVPLSKSWMNKTIKVNAVFDGNELRIKNVMDACISLGINMSVIEINGVMEKKYIQRAAFENLFEYSKKRYDMESNYNSELNEVSLSSASLNSKIGFYQDHCSDLDCGHCRNIHLRVGPYNGETAVNPCFLKTQGSEIAISSMKKVNKELFFEAIQLNGRGPKWSKYKRIIECTLVD